MKRKCFCLVIIGIVLSHPIISHAALNAGITVTLMESLSEPPTGGTAGVTKTLMDALSAAHEEQVRRQKEQEEAEAAAEAERLKKEEAQRKYEEEMGPYEIYDSPGGSFKSFMSWQNITSRSSMQWKLQNWAAYTDWYTGLREIDGRVCIALGSYYGAKIGSYVDLIMENGSTIKCIMADQKADEHTDPTHRWHSSDGSVGEFLVEKSALPKVVRQMGDISYIHPVYQGNISKIKVYEKMYSFD